MVVALDENDDGGGTLFEALLLRGPLEGSLGYIKNLSAQKVSMGWSLFLVFQKDESMWPGVVDTRIMLFSGKAHSLSWSSDRPV